MHEAAVTHRVTAASHSTREALINAVLGEDAPGGMRWCHYIWCV